MAVSMAIASGKGGVGKTTTGSNLAIYFAGKGLKTGLIDIDPLSDVAVIFDLPKELFSNKESVLKKGTPLESYTVNILPDLDILFPVPKSGPKESILLFDMLKYDYSSELDSNYDILIYDMPAGLQENENLNFLSLADHLVLVTNPDPGSHVAAGAYLKAAFSKTGKRNVIMWHNRFRGYRELNFNPSDIIGNYNKNMPPEESLNREDFDIYDAAFIPEDRSLDLLQGDPGVLVQILRNIDTILEMIHTDILNSINCSADISDRMMTLIKFYFRTHPVISSREEALGNLAAYIAILSGISIKESKTEKYDLFTEDQKRYLTEFIKQIQGNSLRKQLIKTERLINQKIASLESKASLFSVPMSHDPGSALDRELSVALIGIQKAKISSLKNSGSLLLFYFSLYKLFQSDKLLEILISFIPRKKEDPEERDRYVQIRNLLKKDNSYKKSYLKLVKTFLPLVSKQIANAARTFELNSLIFRDRDGKIIKEVYLKLTSSFIHEAINSGLGIIINFDYRPASRAFTKAAEDLIKYITPPDKEQP